MKQAPASRTLNWAIAQTIVFVMLACSGLFDCLLYFSGRSESLLFGAFRLLCGAAGTVVSVSHIHRAVRRLIAESSSLTR